MKKDVLIHVRGLQMMDPEEEQEPIEIVVPGQYYYRNGSHYLRYEEMMDDTAEPTVNRHFVLFLHYFLYAVFFNTADHSK